MASTRVVRWSDSNRDKRSNRRRLWPYDCIRATHRPHAGHSLARCGIDHTTAPKGRYRESENLPKDQSPEYLPRAPAAPAPVRHHEGWQKIPHRSRSRPLHWGRKKPSPPPPAIRDTMRRRAHRIRCERSRPQPQHTGAGPTVAIVRRRYSPLRLQFPL